MRCQANVYKGYVQYVIIFIYFIVGSKT